MENIRSDLAKYAMNISEITNKDVLELKIKKEMADKKVIEEKGAADKVVTIDTIVEKLKEEEHISLTRAKEILSSIRLQNQILQ